MFKRTLILIAALLFSSLTYPVFAEDNNGESDNSSAQQDKNSDFDNWYKPDETYPTDDQQQTTENSDKADGPDEGPFLAPDQDQRSKVR